MIDTEPAGPVRDLARTVALVAGNRELRRVELAYVGFNVAEWAVWVALVVYAYERGGTTMAAVVAVVQLVPAAIFAPIGAVLGDRYRAGRVLLAGYVAQVLGMALTASVLLADGPAPLAYACAALAATAVTVTRPTMSALMPTLARSPAELTATNVASGWIESVATLSAPAVAGALLALSGAGTVFLVMAVAVAGSAALVVAVPGPGPSGDPDERESVRAAMLGAAHVLRNAPTARFLVVLLIADFVVLGALDVLYPALAVEVLGLEASSAGYLNAVFGAGATVAVVLTSRLVGSSSLSRPMLVGLAVYALAFPLLAAFPALALAVGLLAIAAAGRAVFDVAARTLLQRVAPAQALARVFGLIEGVAMAATAAGSLLVAGLAAVGGALTAIVAIGIGVVIIALLAGRRLIDADRHADVPVVEIGLLRALPLFSPLPPPALEGLARSLIPVAAPAGTVVVAQGDEGDRFYVIADGSIEVERDGRVLARLGRGDGFGEIALLRGVVRTATCTAITQTSLYALEAEDFLAAVALHPRATSEARRLADERHAVDGAEITRPAAGATRSDL